MKLINVAIDGFSSCGKSTMAKQLARDVHYLYVDTGAMYRAVALYCLHSGIITANSIDQMALQHSIDNLQIAFAAQPDATQHVLLNGKDVEEEIRTLLVSDAASRVSAISFVRHHLVRQQQQMGKAKGVVMDGRDIGTVVFPDAELKVFVTAQPEVRAERRYRELQAKGMQVDFAEVLDNVRERDERDQNRAESPLRCAVDARLLDNSSLTLEEQYRLLRHWFDEVIAQ